MAGDWYDTLIKMRAKKLINQAQKSGLGFATFMKEASKNGVSSDPDVQSYAAILHQELSRTRSEGRQSKIAGAVGKALAPQTLEPQMRQMSEPMPMEQYADYLKPTQTSAPQTEEQFMGAMGRQPLSPDITTEDVNVNPQFAFARGSLTSEQDELANARLKVQQDAEARKLKQINEKQQQADLRLRLQDRELAWKYYNAGVNAMKPEFENADDWDKKAEEATTDFGEAEANLKKWKTIGAEIGKEDSEYFNQFTPQEVNAQIASFETLMRNAKTQKEMWAKKAVEIRKGSYERGSNISRGSKKTFEEPTERATGPVAPAAPAAGPNAANVAKSFRAEFNY